MMGSAALAARYSRLFGQRFGALTFLRLSSRKGDRRRAYGAFACECGKEIQIAVGRVLNGQRAHCGCLGNKRPNLKHGMRGSREYSSWQGMKGRCLDPGNKDYPRWGGRGITICAEWIVSFEAFYEHIGPRPKGMTVDRINNLKGYEPGNVRWATPSEQQRNRRDSYRWHIKGLTFETHTEAAEHFGVSEHTIWRWVNGQLDKRRNRFTPARRDCHVISRY